LAEKTEADAEKAREIQERNKERTLIMQEIKNRGASTVDELAKATGMEKAELFRHLVAMRQFGKVSIVGERDDQLVYGLP
jgi:predicted transcriptional regulator